MARPTSTAMGCTARHSSPSERAIARLIRWSTDNRLLVLLTTVLLTAWGVVALVRTPLDAIPDLSDVQVTIRTTFPGQAPQICRAPGDVSARDDHALGARREGGARIFDVRRLVRVRSLRRRHGSLLGALARARVPKPGAIEASGASEGVARSGCDGRRLDL